MRKNRKNVIGLDFGKSVVKMVEYSKKEKEIKTVATLFLDPDDWKNETALSIKIKEWIDGKKLAKSVEIVTAISGEYSIIKYIQIPEDETDVENAILWEMSNYLSSPVSEFLIDYQKMPSAEDSSGNKYLAVAHRRTEVEKFKRILNNPRNPLTIVDVDTFAVQNAFEVNYPEDLQTETFIIKADLHGVNCVSTINGEFLNQKFIRIDDDFVLLDESERTAVLIDLIKKINSCISASTGDIKFVLCGDFSADYEFCQLFESSVSVKVDRLNSFKKVVFPHDAEFFEKVQETAPQCATAVGLAMRSYGDQE